MIGIELSECRDAGPENLDPRDLGIAVAVEAVEPPLLAGDLIQRGRRRAVLTGAIGPRQRIVRERGRQRRG